MPFQEYLSRTIVELIEIIEIIAVFIILWNSPKLGINEIDFKRMINVIFFFSLIGAGVGIVYYLFTHQRPIGKWFIPGSFSFGLFYSYFYYSANKKNKHLIYFFIFVLAIILSKTRGLWISTVLAPFIIYTFHYRKILKKIKIRPIVIGGFIFLTIVIFNPDIQDRFSSFFTGSRLLFARPVLWLAGVYMFIDHPFGLGLGNFDYFLVDYIQKLLETGVYQKFMPEPIAIITTQHIIAIVRGPHSDWIKLLSETGFIGVILYIWFWGSILVEVLFKKIRTTESLILATFIIQSFLSTFVSLVILKGGFLIFLILYLFLYFNKMERFN
jgi:O-antigen ligase